MTSNEPTPWLAATRLGRKSHLLDDHRTRLTGEGEIPLTLCGHLADHPLEDNLPACVRCEQAWKRLQEARS